jgi:hypothetical protein
MFCLDQNLSQAGELQSHFSEPGGLELRKIALVGGFFSEEAQMDAISMPSLVAAFASVPDPRKPRGIRHPMPGMLALVFLGLLGRIREMKVLSRWAQAHWDQLREPLGFDRASPPDATTISRALARCSLGEFSQAFAKWLKAVALEDQPLVAAVDGKTSHQALDAQGEPVQLLTVFVQQFKVVLAQWSVRGEKTNEPGVLKKHVAELTADFPLLELITGDAIFAQRPLVQELLAHRCDYLFQVKGNQGDALDAVATCFESAPQRPAHAESEEKRGT